MYLILTNVVYVQKYFQNHIKINKNPNGKFTRRNLITGKYYRNSKKGSNITTAFSNPLKDGYKQERFL